jgi:hypothetical protein
MKRRNFLKTVLAVPFAGIAIAASSVEQKTPTKNLIMSTDLSDHTGMGNKGEKSLYKIQWGRAKVCLVSPVAGEGINDIQER